MTLWRNQSVAGRLARVARSTLAESLLAMTRSSRLQNGQFVANDLVDDRWQKYRWIFCRHQRSVPWFSGHMVGDEGLEPPTSAM